MKILKNFHNWRPERDSNPRITVLQTAALPLGYQAKNRIIE